MKITGAGMSGETLTLSDQALARIARHTDLLQRLTSMVAAELVVANGFSESEALMICAQIFLACAAHTAAFAAREHLKREPDYSKWKTVCDAAFRRAVDRKDEVTENISREEME